MPRTTIYCLKVLGFLMVSTEIATATHTGLFPYYSDDHTVALWLFDETQYPYTTVTDASEQMYDLCLMEGGQIVDGKFGQGLQVVPDDKMSVAYAGYAGKTVNIHMRNPDRQPSGLWGPTIAPEKLTRLLLQEPWTCEFWLKVFGVSDQPVVLLDLGHAFEPGFRIRLIEHNTALVIENAYGGYQAVCRAGAQLGSDAQWHHVAMVHIGSQIQLYLDGRRVESAATCPTRQQPLPEVIIPKTLTEEHLGFNVKTTVAWRQEHRFNFALGEDRQGQQQVHAAFDELRFSDVARYTDNVALPASFSYSYGIHAPAPAVANGVPQLFDWRAPATPVPLGIRKHLFLDGVLLASRQNCNFKCNPPTQRDKLNFRPEITMWRPSVVDINNQVYMYCPEGYGSEQGMTHLRTSTDGVNFQEPNLGLVDYRGTRQNGCVFGRTPFYGTFFDDLNPAIRPFERYKLTAWLANRGLYMFVSPDGIHWRRNESCMLPLVSGGNVETFWDDQIGKYVSFVRRDCSSNNREAPVHSGVRRQFLFETRDVFKTWPFHKLNEPYLEGWPMPNLTSEGVLVIDGNESGEVYRSRAIKYPWAPDVYLAFVWRFRTSDETRRVDLGVSRDGTFWRFFAHENWYFEPGEFDEVLSIYGLIRRGDEIWQYADFGGAHGRHTDRTYYRYTQRLDGFVSLDAQETPGHFITLPLTFQGDQLILNVAARGEVRIEIQDDAGQAFPGFSIEDCDPIKTDAIRHQVTWKRQGDLSVLAGKVVRLKVTMTNAKLYALQFLPGK